MIQCLALTHDLLFSEPHVARQTILLLLLRTYLRSTITWPLNDVLFPTKILLYLNYYSYCQIRPHTRLEKALP